MCLIKLAKPLLCILFFSTILGCATPRYTICTLDDFPLQSVKGCRLIILNNHIINSNQPLFENTIQLLSAQKYEALESFFANDEYPYDDLEFCKALLCFNQGQYEDAQSHLINITDFKFKCLVKLLQTDVEYEMKLSEGLISPSLGWHKQIESQERAKNRSQLLNKYQEVFDCNSSKENHYMVKMRVKQLKYAK